MYIVKIKHKINLLNRSITSNKTEAVIRCFPTETSPEPDESLHSTRRKELT